MRNHPEQAANEVYLGNTRLDAPGHDRLMEVPGVRIGSMVYSLDGEKLGERYHNLAPLFVVREHEMDYDRFMMAR
jgi:hypothetical protein